LITYNIQHLNEAEVNMWLHDFICWIRRSLSFLFICSSKENPGLGIRLTKTHWELQQNRDYLQT